VVLAIIISKYTVVDRTYRATTSGEAARTESGSAGDSSGRWRWAIRGDTALLQRPWPPPPLGDDGSPWPRGERPVRLRGDGRRTSSCGPTCCRPPAARPGTTTTTRPASRTSSGDVGDGGGDDEPRHRRPLPCRQPFPCRYKALERLWHAENRKTTKSILIYSRHCISEINTLKCYT